MSELINKNDSRATIRWKLLTTASAVALLGSGYIAGTALAADEDRPQIWIDLGGQFNGLDAGNEPFVPPFVLRTPRPAPETISPLSVGHAPRYGFEEDAAILFQPEQSNWVFSASIRYGRSSSNQHLRQQSPYPTKPLQEILYTSGGGGNLTTNPPGAEPIFRKALQFIDTRQQNSERHTILDFQAGKDVGLGLFGGNSRSVLSLGVRFAQFRSTTNSAFKSDPDAHPKYFYPGRLKIAFGGTFHSYAATARMARSFHGVGPSISWSGTAPVVGNQQDGQIALDWGANAALLFGRQKTFVHHQTTGHYHQGKYNAYNPFSTPVHTVPPDKIRSRTVTVPNIGGFAGLSFNYADAKLSLGYRADFFFGAIDGGIDTRKNENRGFFGPFASISVGIGD
jgi:hypothetical protein